MPKFGEGGIVYGPDVKKPTIADLDKEDKHVQIENRPDGNTTIISKELPDELKEDSKKSVEEILKKHGVDKIE